MLKSNLCNQAQLESERFRYWASRMTNHYRLHRKLWELCYIAQALDERGMLQPGKRGLGFGVGREPLAELFACHGCEVVATDQSPEQAQQGGWVATAQHAASLAALNERGICPPDQFQRLASFRYVDMNAIPADLRGFDFTWSSCAFEHLGSIERGMQFIENQMHCLKPGGVAVHTTEYNVFSNDDTIDNNDFLVLFRRRDLEALARRLRRCGHTIDLDFTLGTQVADTHIDLPPYVHPHCLKIQWDRFVTTSIGLIVEKKAERSARWLAWLPRLKRAG